MKTTIEIETNKLNNNTLFNVLDECTKQGVNTKEVDTILVWVGNKLHKLEFAWNADRKIFGLQRKW
jgi:hypothetical protein